MKKLIPIFLVLLTLVGCTSINKTPIYNTDFSSNAVYTIGDYSFSCKISWKEKVSNVVITSTRAKGLSFSCDGDTLTYSKSDMSKSVKLTTASPLNPAKIFYQVMTSLPKAKQKASNGTTTYIGTIPIGEYTLTTKSTKLQSLTIPTAKINIVFD